MRAKFAASTMWIKITKHINLRKLNRAINLINREEISTRHTATSGIVKRNARIAVQTAELNLNWNKLQRLLIEHLERD